MRIFLIGLFLLAACGGKGPTPVPPVPADSFVIDYPAGCPGKPECIHVEGKLKPGAKVTVEQAKMMILYAISGSK